MKKMVAVMLVVAVAALSSTAVTAAPVKGAEKASERSIIQSLSFFSGLTAIFSGFGQERAAGKGKEKEIQSPDSTTEGFWWGGNCARNNTCDGKL